MFVVCGSGGDPGLAVAATVAEAASLILIVSFRTLTSRKFLAQKSLSGRVCGPPRRSFHGPPDTAAHLLGGSGASKKQIFLWCTRGWQERTPPPSLPPYPLQRRVRDRGVGQREGEAGGGRGMQLYRPTEVLFLPPNNTAVAKRTIFIDIPSGCPATLASEHLITLFTKYASVF